MISTTLIHGIDSHAQLLTWDFYLPIAIQHFVSFDNIDVHSTLTF